MSCYRVFFFFFSSRRRHTRFKCDWSSDVCSSDLNLLAATVYAQSLKLGTEQLNSFHGDSFAIAVVLHGVGSIFVGLLYGAMLPMFARRPIVLGGLIAPVLWSGLLYSIMQLLNPLLASRINWVWFMASQIAFGVVAG